MSEQSRAEGGVGLDGDGTHFVKSYGIVMDRYRRSKFLSLSLSLSVSVSRSLCLCLSLCAFISVSLLFRLSRSLSPTSPPLSRSVSLSLPLSLSPCLCLSPLSLWCARLLVYLFFVARCYLCYVLFLLTICSPGWAMAY